MGRVLTAAAFVALVLAVVTGCGGAALVLQPVAQAATKTEDAGSAKVDLTMTLTAKGQTITIPGSGVADMKSGDADITIDMSKLTAQAGSQATGTDMTEITKDGIVYLKIPFKGMPAGKQWLKIDPKAAAKAAGLPFAQQTGQTPGQAVGILKNASTEEKVGTETIDGVETTHYRTTIDTAKLFNSGSSNAQPWMKTALQNAPKSEAFDVWVDSSSLIRRMTFDMGTKGATMAMTMDFSDFGTPLNVQAPPADETVNGLDLLKQTSSSTS